MANDYAIYYTLWFLVTCWLIWGVHRDNQETKRILDRMDRRTVLMSRYLGMDDTDEEEVP